MTNVVDNYPVKHTPGQLESISHQVELLRRNSGELNTCGYVLLPQRRYQQAIAVLVFNTIVYPQEATTFDSLAEAYLITGDKKKVLHYYKRALQLDGNLTSVKE